ncbi:hypothetical protein J7I98_02595 [Streptomyces sp. ISL-98]|uniref:hypothetical protein n=1 Tax=Streptomyces sp. ISL-98 TaxID=2819192 RepID=UPI001BE6115E|nr:hypothetical protein [Streptomyces sp. ISL-98]MBT2504799.1 hypothetical protein [Streptomyces sp. ISL-98]
MPRSQPAGIDRWLRGLVGSTLGRLGRAGGVVFLLAGLALTGVGAYQGAYAAGWAGTHGTLTVESCEVTSPHNVSRSSRKNRSTIRCCGTFASDDGKAKDINAALEGKRGYLQGTEVSVQQTDAPTADADTDADYVVAGLNRAMHWFAAFFAGWVLTGLGVFCVATGYAPFGSSRISYGAAWDAAGRNATRPTTIGMIGVGIVGAGLSYLVSLFI